jgi:hypothetical protein
VETPTCLGSFSRPAVADPRRSGRREWRGRAPPSRLQGWVRSHLRDGLPVWEVGHQWRSRSDPACRSHTARPFGPSMSGRVRGAAGDAIGGRAIVAGGTVCRSSGSGAEDLPCESHPLTNSSSRIPTSTVGCSLLLQWRRSPLDIGHGKGSPAMGRRVGRLLQRIIVREVFPEVTEGTIVLAWGDEPRSAPLSESHGPSPHHKGRATVGEQPQGSLLKG